MKKVLILAYDFEPLNSIGAQRPLAWFKYFKEFGIHPIVITRHWDKITDADDLMKASIEQSVKVTENKFGTIIRVPYKPNFRDKILLHYGLNKFAVLRKIFSLILSVGQYFWVGLDNRSNIHSAAKNYLKENKCKAIIATGEPFILFRYAHLLSEEFSLPWIADYRDGWSQNYAVLQSKNTLQKWINKNLFARIEKRLVQTSTLCTFTVESHQKEVEELVPNIESKIIMNGYFEELFEPLSDNKSSTHPFTIAYSGTIYPYQELEIFLEGFLTAIKQQGLEPKDIQLIFYGLNYQPEQLKRVLDFSEKLKPFIRTTERMPLQEVIVDLNKADALLLLATPIRHQVYAKVFDYVALKKPIILAVNDHGPLEKILQDSPRPMVVETKEHVANSIKELLLEPDKIINQHIDSAKYSRKNQAKKMAELVFENLKKQKPHTT